MTSRIAIAGRNYCKMLATPNINTNCLPHLRNGWSPSEDGTCFHGVFTRLRLDGNEETTTVGDTLAQAPIQLVIWTTRLLVSVSPR